MRQMHIWKRFFQNFRRKRGLYETRLCYSFYRTFLCSSIFFLEALLQEYVLFCQIMLLFFWSSLTAGSTFLPDDRLKMLRKKKNFRLFKTRTVTERTGTAVCFQKTRDSCISADYHSETTDTSELPENQRI